MNFSESLKKNTDFRKVYHGGHSKANKYLVIYIRKNGTDKNRVGISVSKKVGNSVKRNRARRLMRESVRISDAEIRQGYDLIIIARNTINGKKCADVKKSIEAALRRLKVIEKKKVEK